MPDLSDPISDKENALRKAVTDYIQKTGVNAVTISVITERIAGLLAGRWDHICDVALEEENKGKVAIGFRVTIDMTHKCPVGTVVLSFSQITKDECDYAVPDPDQIPLPFGQTTPPSVTPFSTTSPANGGSTSTAAPSTETSASTSTPRRRRQTRSTPEAANAQ